MTDPNTNEIPAAEPRREARQRRFPHIDLVTIMLAILAVFILLFLTAELWLPHVPH